MLGLIGILRCLTVVSLSVLPCEQPGPQPAPCEEVGLLSGGGPQGPSGTGRFPQVPGVGVQLREPPVRGGAL